MEYRPSCRSRKGSNTVEFALILPIFVALLAAAFEYSWYFYVQTMATDAVRLGCRTGAVVPTQSAHSPSDAASDAIKTNMTSSGVFGIDCHSSEDDRCSVSVSVEGDAPTQTIQCSIALEYPGMTGLVPTPATVVAKTVQLLEIQ